MPISDKIEAPGDPGFNASIAPDVARRQFRMSLGLVAVIAVAIALAAATTRFEPRAGMDLAATKLTVQQPLTIQVRSAEEGARPRL